jgi:predicted nucleic acid-binding protein
LACEADARRCRLPCRRDRPNRQATDALIAATAIEHRLPVVTQDDNFDAMAAAHPLLEVARV